MESTRVHPETPAPAPAGPTAMPHSTPGSGQKLIPLAFKGQQIQLATTGLAVIDQIAPGMFENKIESVGHHLVLGLTSPTGPQSMLDITLGQVKFRRYLACARCKMWWMTPEWGTSAATLPPETQFLLLELEVGQYAVMLPLIDGSFRATIRSGRDSALVLRVESGDDNVLLDKWNSVLLVAAGSDPYELVDSAVAMAARLSGGALPRWEKVLPPSLDVFGWCTWDAFYSTVSASGITKGLKSLISGGTPPKFCIIDDGWQMTDVDAPYAKPPVAALAAEMGLPRVEEFAETAEEDYFQEAESVLSETAAQIQQGSSTGNLMPTLAGIGPAPHHPLEAHHAEVLGVTGKRERREPSTAMRMVQKMLGWIVGLGTTAFLLFYQLVVEPAPPNSLPVKLFAATAKGFLRPALLAFFATASDFTRRLVSVKANGKFADIDSGPDEDWQAREANLGKVVANIKNSFQVRYVYCWHGLPGYWSGIMPNSEASSTARIVYAKPTPGLQEIEPSTAWNPAVLAGIGIVEDPGQLYNEMHRYLAESGVDGVKVDCQAGVSLIGSCVGGGPEAGRKMHAALEDSVKRFFPGNHLINCMCHSTENLYRFARSAVARASDDYYPRDPASSTPHIAACSFNSVFLGALVQPDWDMFQSKHPAALLHAMARAVSGAAVYVSDRPGEHDFNLLKKLVLPDGSVLRARLPGRPTRDSLFADVLRDGVSALKVWNVNAFTGVVGLFNLQGSAWDRVLRRFHTHSRNPPKLQALVAPADVEAFRNSGAPAGARYACYSYASQALSVLAADESMQVELPPGEADIVTLAPLLLLAAGVAVAPLGLANMLNGGGSIMAATLEQLAPRPAPSTSSNVVPLVLAGHSLEAAGGHAPPVAGAHRSSSSGSGGRSASNGAQVVVMPEQRAAGPMGHVQLVSRAPAMDLPSILAVSIKGCGDLLVYSSCSPASVWVNDKPAIFQYLADSCKLLVEVPEAPSLISRVRVAY